MCHNECNCAICLHKFNKFHNIYFFLVLIAPLSVSNIAPPNYYFRYAIVAIII
nr:MAG TPA: hypothetical protein [Caudoviricetes sp.]